MDGFWYDLFYPSYTVMCVHCTTHAHTRPLHESSRALCVSSQITNRKLNQFKIDGFIDDMASLEATRFCIFFRSPFRSFRFKQNDFTRTVMSRLDYSDLSAQGERRIALV